MKKGAPCLFALLFGAAGFAAEGTALSQIKWSFPGSEIGFTQKKDIQGLPLPLHSSGVLRLVDDYLLWHTQQPVEQQLKITADGIAQWQQDQYQVVAGSDFAGQLLLAVLQQNPQFLQTYFVAEELDGDCLLLQPSQLPLSEIFQTVEICGQQQPQQIRLLELNGNRTEIQFAQHDMVQQ